MRLACEEFYLVDMVRRTAFFFTYFYPVILIGSMVLIYSRWSFTFSWGNILAQIVCWWMWGFNVFYVYPKQKIPTRGKWSKLEEIREKLFLAKVAGERMDKS